MSPRAHAALVVVIAGLATTVNAQTLRDPTMPPNAVAAADGGETRPAGPVLQSVLLSKERRSAVIDGQQVGLGGKFGASRVVRITESEVILEGSAGRKTLKLFPDAWKSEAESTDRSPETEGKAVSK